MDIFACAGCGAVLTAPVSRIALPVHARQAYGHELLPALMEPGTYAVDPEPSGPPWRPWSEIGVDEAEARGVFAPVTSLSFGAPGAVVVAPGDTRGTVLIPERCDGYCMGPDGRDGPNLACARCGQEVATRIDDCSYWQAVWLAPHAVVRRPADGPAHGTDDGETPAEEWQGTPPVEPSGAWSLRWEAAAGAALAHLLAASGGAPVAVPDGLAANIFGRALDALLPPGPPVRRAALAGPGLPATDPAPDITLVPRHPRTGKAWQPPGHTEPVPLDAGVWTYLAFPRERLPVPVTGGLPDGVLRDDPPPMRPQELFRPDRRVFLHTLARLPTVRQPWLREIYDRVTGRPYARLF
ncbi:hypothetical protein [Streptomyces griseocarneus]|uniref:hypothetical protein n=1 Tax=Streptomyces griseocarneus TaxID=51201 RepID=UPI00167EA6D8|nr:hypothetical protein [Streptomyces griseocarneus]MBZ6477156.1 hypothetical protein [Streptomyces griseocarneus]GHG53845.1 hypothetical protein GCM10018779_16160 [Streptomyces griseocarneus]